MRRFARTFFGYFAHPRRFLWDCADALDYITLDLIHASGGTGSAKIVRRIKRREKQRADW